jgi:hypothetical protein
VVPSGRCGAGIFVVAIPNRPAPALRSHSLARGNVLTHSVIRTGLNADTL